MIPSTATGGGSATGGTGGATADSGAPGGGSSTLPATQRFAVIGDYGDDLLVALGIGGLARVADLVKSWSVDFVVTTGDNNYPDGAAATIDNNIGKYYAEFIGNYSGAYGPGSAENRFWPSAGNHDWNTPNLQPYIDYFTLPANERYYEVVIGRVHLFAVDSEPEEPDGATVDSAQGAWLQNALASSSACFKVVYFHRPPYSSSDHGSEVRMQWPFEEWGADVVLTGHDHSYERLAVGGIPYFVNGLGGSLRYPLVAPLPESQVFYNEDFGAQLVTVTRDGMTLELHTVSGALIDSHTVAKSCEN
jgi:hypothetical protein